MTPSPTPIGRSHLSETVDERRRDLVFGFVTLLAVVVLTSLSIATVATLIWYIGELFVG